jgi:hypothetical protein
LMAIPLYPLPSFSIVSHQASLNHLPRHLSTWVWAILCLFFLLIFLQRSSYRPGLVHSNNMSKPYQSLNLYYGYNILGFIFVYQFCISFNPPLSYFVCVVIFLNLSGIHYMVSEQLTFFGMGLSALCTTPSYLGGS